MTQQEVNIIGALVADMLHTKALLNVLLAQKTDKERDALKPLVKAEMRKLALIEAERYDMPKLKEFLEGFSEQ